MAFYKKIEYVWFEANKVSNANYTLDENNKQSIDGWTWHDNPPQDYLDWLDEQENIEEFKEQFPNISTENVNFETE